MPSHQEEETYIMLFKAFKRIILGALACLAFASAAAAQRPAWVKEEWTKPAAERLAAVPNLDARLSALEKALDAAKDKASLPATTARYTLDIFKDVKANPKAYGPFSSTVPTPDGGKAPRPRPTTPTAPLKNLADYISPVTPFPLDLDNELKRAEQIAAALKAGRDPMAGVTGDVHLAYRSGLDGMLMPFRVYVPKNYAPQRVYPLVIFLHGSSCDENSYMAQDVLQPVAERMGYLVASVNGRGPFSSYLKENGGQQDVLDVMALMQKYYHVDPNRIYMTGHSMGGGGTWSIGLEFRDKFAALAPQAGVNSQNRAGLDAKLASGRKIPILITAGGKDTTSSPEAAIEAYNKLKTAGYPAKVVVYPDSVHIDVFPNSAPEVFWWFEQHSK
jgi:acetyl esterase/lipase